MEAFRKLRARVKEALFDESITRKDIALAGTLVLLLYAGSVMMFFGMNFWLWSFTAGLKRSYTTIFAPSVAWASMFLLTVGLDTLINWIRYGRVQNMLFWVTRRGVLLVFLIGLFDSLTGLTGMYASVHVPQILQSALISTGPIWTFILSYFIFPESQPFFHPLLLGVVLCIGTGVVLALLPQVLDDDSDHRYFSVPWTIIYLAATALFPLYNVLQGRFLNDFKDHCSPFTRKMVMLSVETTIQLFLTIGYFPVDFSPFYGRCSSAGESWENFIASMRCIGTCHNNALYMVIYVMGFWIRHVVFAYLNTYSPSVAAVTSMLTQPINAFFLLAIPSWNVFGSKKDWRYTLGCFFALLSGMVLFIIWHLLYKPRPTSVAAEKEDLEDETPCRSRDSSKLRDSGSTHSTKQGHEPSEHP